MRVKELERREEYQKIPRRIVCPRCEETIILDVCPQWRIDWPAGEFEASCEQCGQDFWVPTDKFRI